MTPRYSIVIPARNAADTLRPCLQALRELDYPADGFEVVVVDDASSDDTAAVARSFGARVESRTCGSIPQVRNLGASLARGEIIVHFDSDMVAPPDFLRRADVHYGSGYTGCLSFVLDVPADANLLARLWYSPLRRRQTELRRVDHLNSANLFVPRQIIEQVGGLDEELFRRKRGGSDKEYTYRIHLAGFPLLLDPSARVINLGYERSLWQFLRKEWWHQGNMLFIARAHGYPFRLLRNPLVSLYHLLGLLALVAAVAAGGLWPLLVLAMWSAPSLAMVLALLPRDQWARMAPPLWGITFLRWNAAGLAVATQAAKLARESWSAA